LECCHLSVEKAEAILKFICTKKHSLRLIGEVVRDGEVKVV